MDATDRGPGSVVVSGDDAARPTAAASGVAADAALVARLRRAVELGELEVDYQPIVDARSGRWVAVEALARWRTADGVVPPDVFVPPAEQHGLVPALDALVARTAIAEAARLAAAPGDELTLHLNVSAASLTDGHVLTAIVEAATLHGFPTERIVIEVTETSPVVDLEGTRDALVEARLAGLGVALDDFSAGHTSLHLLAHLPITMLKLDRGLVTGAATSRRWQRLLRVFADAGREFGTVVVAEGVETAEDLAVVRAAGCDQAQGYHLARPLTTAGLRAATAASVALPGGPGRPLPPAAHPAE
ncbi:EAL domain-containing protein [Actinotalea ferrariae]|nr:EAL domain-containing protein [Actinotalea ferrariae]